MFDNAKAEADADRLEAEHGRYAYAQVKLILRSLPLLSRERRHWWRVRRILAKRIGRDIGLRASDRWGS